jgi:bilin biosynthesis protein
MKSISRQINDLSSVFPWVRERAINNLVNTGLPAVKEILLTLDTPYAPICINSVSSDDPDWDECALAVARWKKLLEVLVRIGTPALSELGDALRHSNPNARISAMHVIGKIGDPSFIDLVLPFTQSKLVYERAWSVGALGYAHLSKYYEVLITALNDEDSSVKESAIRALGDLGDDRALPTLKQIVDQDRTLIETYGLTLGDVAKHAIVNIHHREKY